MLGENEVRQMLIDLEDRTSVGSREALKGWQLDRFYGAQKAVCVIYDILGSTARGETSLDCWRKFLETGN